MLQRRWKEPKQGKNGQIPLFMKIFYNLPLFEKYLVIYHFFETQFCGNRVFMVLEFIKLEYHEKFLKFFYVT